MLSHESRCEYCFEACKRLFPETCSCQTKLLKLMVQFSCVIVKQSTGLCAVQSSAAYWLVSKVKMVCKTHVDKILMYRLCFCNVVLALYIFFFAMSSPRWNHGTLLENMIFNFFNTSNERNSSLYFLVGYEYTKVVQNSAGKYKIFLFLAVMKSKL